MEINKKTLRTLILGAAACIFFYWLLHETSRIKAVISAVANMVSPFVVGAVLAFILNVPMRAIERPLKGIKKTGVRRGLAIVLTLLAVVMVLTGVIYLLVPQLIITVESLIETIPDFFQRVQEQVTEFLNENPEIMEWLMENTEFESFNWQSLIEKAVSIVSNGLTAVVDRVIEAVIGLSTGIFNAVLSFVFCLYCLARKEILARQGRRILYSFLPERGADETIRILRMTNSTFSNFISGQCLEALILGCMFAVSMLIFRMPYIPLISVIIAVTALVPIVGAFVGCIIGAFLILMVDPQMALWFVIMFLVLQQIEGNMIYPRVVGTSIGLPGMWVLVAVAVGGDLMGVAGMLLMIPLTSVLYALTREFTDTRLTVRQISKDKLMDHPPVLKSGFKEKRDKRKQRKLLEKMLQMKAQQKQPEDAE